MRQHADKCSHAKGWSDAPQLDHPISNLFSPNPLNPFPIPSTESPPPTRYPQAGVLTMSTELKSETSRMNGAKSNGPTTPEGKARSSAFNSETILLPEESAEHFHLLLADYMDRFQPQDGVEADLVEIMVVARWRLRRLLSIEAHQLHLERGRRGKQIREEFPNIDHGGSLAFVFQKLSDHGNSLKLILRYEAQINRSYEKALKQLQQLQSTRPVGSFRKPSNQESPSSPPPLPTPSPDSNGGVSFHPATDPSPEPPSVSMRTNVIASTGLEKS